MNKQFKVIIVSFSFITVLIIATIYSNLKRLDRIEESLENINTNLEKLESQYRSLEDRIKTLEDNIFFEAAIIPNSFHSSRDKEN